jgi:hypothetical protein
MNLRGQALGPDPDQKQRSHPFPIAIGLFICSTIFFAGVPLLTPMFRVLWWEYLALGLVAGSAVLAVREQGLRRVWIYVFAFGSGCGIHLGGIGISGEMPGLPFRVLWAVVIGFVTATVLGTVGGVIGLGLRRLTTRNKSGQ